MFFFPKSKGHSTSSKDYRSFIHGYKRDTLDRLTMHDFGFTIICYGMFCLVNLRLRVVDGALALVNLVCSASEEACWVLHILISRLIMDVKF